MTSRSCGSDTTTQLTRLDARLPCAPAPYGLDVIRSCVTCSLRGPGFFCDLPSQAVEALDALRQFSVYPKGAMLFVEGQRARGAFLVCSGRVKLTVSSQ